jgi:hypothetical protein
MSESLRKRSFESLSREEVQALVMQLEKMEAQIHALSKRTMALERRQKTFTMFFRFLLELYDRNAARLHLLDGRSGKEPVEEVLRSKPARTLRHKQQRRHAHPLPMDLETADER